MKPESFLPPEVVTALESGHTEEAVKLLRELRGLGFAEARSAVHQHLERMKTAPSDAPPGGSLPPQVIDAQRGEGVAVDHGLAPGEQKRSNPLFWLVVLLAAVVAAYLLYWAFEAGG